MNWKQKLTSRKLWVALIGLAVGIAIASGADPDTAREIGGMVLSGLSVLGYLLVQGAVDKVACLDELIDPNELLFFDESEENENV